MTPTAMNISPEMRPCATIWNVAPPTPYSVNTISPRMTYPIDETEEYATIRLSFLTQRQHRTVDDANDSDSSDRDRECGRLLPGAS